MGKPPAGVGDDQRHRPRHDAVEQLGGSARQFGDRRLGAADTPEEQRGGLAGWAVLERVQAGAGVGVPRGARDAVHRVGGDHGQLAGQQAGVRTGRDAHPERPSTTRSIPARSVCTATSPYPRRSSSDAIQGACPSPHSTIRTPRGSSRSRAGPSSALVDLAAVGSRDRCQLWLELAHLGVEPRQVARGDVGRVGQDRVEAAPCDAIQQVALHELHLQPQPLRIGPGDGKRARRDVGGRDPRPGQLGGNRQGDGAGAGADVQHPRLLDTLEQRQRPLDDQLGLGPGHQHPLVDRQLDRPETAAAGDVGDRLPAAAPADQLADLRQLLLGQRAIVVGVELDPGHPQGMGQQQLRVEPRRRAALLLEVAGTRSQHLAERLHSAAAAASWRRRSSAARASVKSRSDPASTESRLWTVRPIRWSVTRFCGKL